MKSLIAEAEKKVFQYFELVDEIKEFNQEKVLNSFKKNKISAQHFSYVTGYGHDDVGREALDKLFADIFNTEKAIVRNQFVSGTHAIACCFFGCLRHGDTLLSVAGAPYDTLEELIGKRGDNPSSLKAHGINYKEIELINNEYVDFEALEKNIDKSVKMVTIQRSRGYSLRQSLNIDTIGKIIAIVKSKNPDCICFVDNCYGEFVEKLEPTDVGADLIAGSLIKNPGAGIVETGGYVAGKAQYVELAAQRLTAPGIGEWGGSMLNQSRLIFQGIFMAPGIVSEAIKGSILASQVFSDMGFISTPQPQEIRTDIIQTIKFGEREKLLSFCKTIQACSPVDSHLTPVPDEVVGYDNQLIMAGGTFIEGSTIELSADGPLREPYAVFMQGGLNYAHIKITLRKILESGFRQELSVACSSDEAKRRFC